MKLLKAMYLLICRLLLDLST